MSTGCKMSIYVLLIVFFEEKRIVVSLVAATIAKVLGGKDKMLL